MIRKALAVVLALAISVAGVPVSDVKAGSPTLLGAGKFASAPAAATSFDAVFNGTPSYTLNGSPSTFGSIFSFTRASQKYAPTTTGALTSFATDAPAITNLGWNYEIAATNLVLQTKDLSQSPWGPQTVTATANASAAPDGTTTMSSIVEQVSGVVGHFISQTVVASTTAGNYAVSIYVKGNGRNLNIGPNDGVANGTGIVLDTTACANLGTTSVGSTFTLVGTPSVASAGGSCFVSFVVNVPAGVNLQLGLSLNNGTGTGWGGPQYAGNGTSGVYVWQPNVTQQPSVTTTISTGSSAATRAVDAGALVPSGIKSILITYQNSTTQTYTNGGADITAITASTLTNTEIVRMQGFAGAPLAFDGAGTNAAGGSPGSITCTLSTTKANDLILVHIPINGGTVSSVSSPSIGAFTKRADNGSGSLDIEAWYGIATGILTSEPITISSGGSIIFSTCMAVNGVRLGSPFDGTAITSQTFPSDPINITTTNAKTMIVGSFRTSGCSQGPGTGYTETIPAVCQETEFQIVNTAVTSFPVTLGTGAGSSNGAIIDALVQGP